MGSEPYRLYEVPIALVIGETHMLLETKFSYGRDPEEARTNFTKTAEELMSLWQKSNPSWKREDFRFGYHEVKVPGIKINVEPLEQMVNSGS
jgi:hypothetical protein